MTVRRMLDAKPIKEVKTIAPTATLADVIAVLGPSKIGALIVSETGKDVAGIISERDVVRAFSAKGRDALDLAVSEVMTAKVVSAEPGDKAESVMARMSEGRFRHMPVLDAGALIGVISIGDVVKERMAQIEHENAAMTNLISGAV